MFRFPNEEDEDSPWPLFARLLETHEELDELKNMLESEIRLAFLFRHGDWGRNGRTTLGVCICQPSTQGELRPLFVQLLEDALGFYPDFLIILNGEWWADATEQQRSILIFHEALHAGHATDKYGAPRYDRETGRPVPCIRPHDIEEFGAVVRRYGPWKGDVARFLDDARAYDPTANAIVVEAASNSEPVF